MDEQNKNLILATVLSFVVLMVWFLLFPPPEDTGTQPAPTEAVQTEGGITVPAAEDGAAGAPSLTQTVAQTREQALAKSERVEIETEHLTGSLSLTGGRIDDLSFTQYFETLAPDSPMVTQFMPAGTADAYYALFGWTPAAGTVPFDQLPGPTTPWSVESGEVLTASTPVTLVWDNDNGLVFRRIISIDEDYMFTVEQSVENNTGSEIRLAPYGIIARHGEPTDLKGFYILHEGVVMSTDGELAEVDYDDVVDLPVDANERAAVEKKSVAENGWIGFTDHYWMATLVPSPGQAFTAVTKYSQATDTYQTDVRLPVVSVAPGETTSSSTMLFSGPKEWETIRDYQNNLGIEKFVDSIDWGWFFFLTKPIYMALHYLYVLFGNMGFAIIGLTFAIKALLFPLAYKSYVSMSRMKKLQPEMEKIKETVGDDRMKMQQEVMALYKREKVNPAAGCLPILLQIPIFFSLYKVIFVTLELRHQPFIGWVHDLSAPDPSSLLNLFGLLPWDAPDPSSFLALFSIGVWPILMGISMWLQMRLNPAPTDKTQAMIFNWMPWVFMFMLGRFASGLVIYWVANNCITFTQQYLIMRSQGVKPDILGNIRGKTQADSKQLMEARVTHIWRHPIKGVGAEALLSSEFVAGNTMPYDRVWAIAHEASKAPAGSSDWVHCNNFIRGAKSPGLMAVKARMTGPEGLIELTHPDAGRITVDPGDLGDAARMVAWVTPLCDPNRALPSHVVRAGTRGMTDSKIRSISILNNASLAALSKAAGKDLARERFRGNIWLDGLEPWQEFDLIDETLRIGGATFVVRERITRCAATTVDPETGKPDTDTLRLLQENWGHRDFGVYAEVVEDGIASVKDVAVLA